MSGHWEKLWLRHVQHSFKLSFVGCDSIGSGVPYLLNLDREESYLGKRDVRLQ